MRYRDEPETYDETFHCIPCKWEGYPIIAGSSTSVPFGSTWADLEDFELLCPECKEEATEGGLPEGVLDEEDEE